MFEDFEPEVLNRTPRVRHGGLEGYDASYSHKNMEVHS